MRALLIVNPGAGQRTAKDGDLERAIGVLKDGGVTIETVETGADGPTAEDLARRAVAERYDACIVAGGDGTVQPAARALAGTDVVLGILPFGTHMNIAHGLDIPLEPIDAARVIARGNVHRADGGVVHGRLFFEIAGVGLDAELFGAARNAERGRWRKAFGRMWRYATHGTHRVTITVDGAVHAHHLMQILVLNSRYYGWSLPLLPDASMDDGLLDVAVFPRMGRLALIGVIVALARGAALP
ncbi:MAG TPA: diacylglycerol kinase family protein, partial [Methylomirabilota bacterium]|nr:diacylglycerol kinase family protein [Methylomirabilota bacterium]